MPCRRQAAAAILELLLMPPPCRCSRWQAGPQRQSAPRREDAYDGADYLRALMASFMAAIIILPRRPRRSSVSSAAGTPVHFAGLRTVRH